MAEQPSFRSIPKVELHLHLGGSYPLDYLFSIATAEQKQELEKNLAAISQKVDYHEVFAAFNVILESLSPDRIGHAVFLTPEAKAWILTHRVPIEVCPTSSVLVQMVEKYQDHPGLQYLMQGHPIIICTDDPLIFQNSLSSEFQTLSESGLTHEQLHQVAASSFDHAFLSKGEKQKLKKLK